MKHSYNLLLFKYYIIYNYISIFCNYNDIKKNVLKCIICKKNIKLSTNRNKIKRILKITFNLIKNKLPFYEYVIIINKKIIYKKLFFLLLKFWIILIYLNLFL